MATPRSEAPVPAPWRLFGRRALSLAAVLSALVLQPATTQATTMPDLSLSELVYVSEVVVEATVLSVQVERRAGAEGVQSLARLQVDHAWKGDVIEGDVLQVREWGGILGTQRTDVSGGAVYAPGERVLVLLEADRREAGGYRTLGMSMGKWTLVAEPDTGRDIALRVAVPHGLQQFDERAVRLPAFRTYADEIVSQIALEVAEGFVPAYTTVPGLLPARDLHFLEESLRFGHSVDPRIVARVRARAVEAGVVGGAR